MSPAKNNVRGSHTFRRLILAAGAALILPSGGCNKEPPMHCYDLDKGQLSVYVEERSGKGELGSELHLPVSSLMIKDGPEPLAYSCTSSGHLFWVTKDMVYIKKLTFKGGMLKADKVLDIRHTSPDEYAVPGVRVISADIWSNPDEKWQGITMATLTNTGLLQVARYSIEGFINNKFDRGIFDLSRKLNPENCWPKEGVAGGVVRVLGREMFVVIPIGEKGKGNVRNFYNITVEGKMGEPFYSREMTIHTMKIWKASPELRNIIEISAPVRYDLQNGGWIANLTGEKEDGSAFQMFPILTPKSR